MLPMPIDRTLPELIAALRTSRSAVLVAPPGAGKTTRVPPAVLRSGLLSAEHPNLVMLQPRRVAARAAAARIASEQGWAVGNEVGYHVRFDRKISARSRIRVLTEGILTRQLLDDPGLDGIGAVLLDEFHERSLHTDIAIALLREVQESLRPDLLLIVMSATLSAEPVAKFLNDAPIVRSEGRMFPIDVRYTQKPMPPAWAIDEVPGALAQLLSDPKDDDGDVLVFLPGTEEIRRTQRRLENGIPLASNETSQPAQSRSKDQDESGRPASAGRGLSNDPLKRGDRSATQEADASKNSSPAPETPAPIKFKTHASDLLILPLHGTLTADEQDLALCPSERRKIILATNIAETSLTIEGVTNVIDTGLARLASYDAERGLDRLDLSRISRASADQRAGRAGRTAPGRCIRLWSEKEHHALAPFGDPEIRRVDLAGTVLSLHAWGVNPRTFGWFEPPSESAIESAENLLEMLGALERGTGGSPVSAANHGRAARVTHASPARITPLGKRMSNLPMHPRLARLLVAAQDAGLSREGATLAAMLSEKDVLPFEPDRDARRASVTGDSDVLYRLQRLEAGDRSLDHVAVKQVNAARHQFLQAITRSPQRTSTSSVEPGEGGGEKRSDRAQKQSTTGTTLSGDQKSTPPAREAQSGDRSPAQKAQLDDRPHLTSPGGRGTGSSSESGWRSTKPSTNLSLPSGESRSEGERRAALTGEEDLLKLILLAYPDRVCKRRAGDPTQAVMVGGGGVRIGTESIVSQPELFVAIDARHDNFSRQQQAVVRIASRVEAAWLEELLPRSIRRETTAEFDEQRGKVIGVRRTLYRDRPLSESIEGAVDDESAARVLAKIIRPRAASLLREDEHLAPLMARLQLLAEHMPDHPWPIAKKGDITLFEPSENGGAVDGMGKKNIDEEKAEQKSDVSFFASESASNPEHDWIAEACNGCRTIEEVKRKLPQALRNQLVYPLDRLLDQHAPESVEVPTGNRIKIDYKPGQRPVLAVRLQEIFGWLDTPRIAIGKVPLLMHLLGPNYRPVQITDDLRSFWATTYFQVRKDLRVRYPKHSWPEDPLTATPQAKGRRRP